ncbi:hypothetical protein [Sphingomonas trueperi]|uniref:hypothetical protein n=1 Tax=Sphingomonas trueperi TaxID=53317 RepID=UPI000EABD0AF
MTQAILPLNVRALRVNLNDAQLLTSNYKGRVAQFESMPYTSSSTVPSTGAAIFQPLESDATPIAPLKAGMHLHWELPDVYRRGVQGPEGGDPVFPAAPDTWLVIRYLQRWDTNAQSYGPVEAKAFIVESDFVQPQLAPDPWGVTRPAITVPLPLAPKAGEQPFRYMGRVRDYADWNGPDGAGSYLTAYPPCYLNSIGFVGPSFSSYYPECNSVFGFWDSFADAPDIAAAINNNSAIRFRVSYQVIGWLRDPTKDVFAGFGAQVIKAYDAYVASANAQNATVAITPADELARLAQQNWRLAFNTADIAWTINPDKTIATLDAPEQGLCSGIAQELVWDMLATPGTTYFLNNPDGPQPNAVWSDDQITLAAGNTAIEGLSALIKSQLAPPDATAQQLSDVEQLLDALQLGLLHDLEEAGNSLIVLDETLHSRGFAKEFGGYVWAIQSRATLGTPGQDEVTLPLALAELLAQLNTAQKAYDQGRAELDTIRRQLFMDWLRYVAAYVNPNGNLLKVTIDDLAAFIDSNGPDCELGYVQARGEAVGMLDYVVDATTGAVTSMNPPPSGSSGPALAAQVWTAWQAVRAALPDQSDWVLQATPERPFWAPTDPVLVMEGDRIEPVRRNGDATNTPARIAAEILDQLDIQAGTAGFTLAAAAVPGQPVITAATPMRRQVEALVAEGALLIPMLAANVATAAAALPGDGNPAISDPAGFVAALNAAQGGLSPLDPPSPTGQPESLYTRLQAPGAPPIENAVQQVTAPIALGFTFTNAAGTGWTPYGTALSAQTSLPEFTPTRVDPFLPVFLIWEATLDPLSRASGWTYAPGTITTNFALNGDRVDYTYAPGANFTTGTPLTYSGSVTLSRQTTRSLTAQIDQYERFYPKDPSNDTLNKARALYSQARIMSQGIGGYNQEMLLRTQIARVPVEDLIKGGRDTVTSDLDDAARAVRYDNWYSYAFNAVAPISFGPLAEANFGPLRGGFATIRSLEVVDVFGQRMTLKTTAMRADGSQDAIPAFPLAPVAGDTAHAQSLYLPPRLIPPARVWFKFLSATHDSSLSADFVETNSHPATSPICGIVLPNHLDETLVFYQPGGEEIGSFGVEHGALVYRTRADNSDNPGDSLAIDIGAWQTPPKVNPHLYDLMWHIDRQDADFLSDLLATIAASSGFINPANYAQNVNLAVLIGQPLVITRAVIGIETAGGVLPVSQADTSVHPDFTNDVEANRFRYPDREATGAAGLQSLAIPLQLGNLANIDDGMIGFFIDGQGSVGPYGTFYAPEAPASGDHGVVQPSPDTLSVTLNATPIAITFLMDPRAPVHVTSGILPVEQIAVPPDQYGAALNRLEVSFITRPVLRRSGGLVLPLPLESGYGWSWIQQGQAEPLPLSANAGTEVAAFGYTPQQLLEGWTRLQKEPDRAADVEPSDA